MIAYLVNILYAIDLLANAMFGGDRHQTISARWGASSNKVLLYYWGCRALHVLDPGHCKKSSEHYDKIKKVGE